MKPAPLSKNLQTWKWYEELCDKITKEEADWWRDDMSHLANNPKPEHLQKLKELLVKKKPDVTDKEVWDASHTLMTLGSIAISYGITKMRKKKRSKTIKEWRGRDSAKDQRVADTKPLEGINCPGCGSEMLYRWSDLYDRGSYKQPDEQVMFFYECPKKCQRKLIFENGEPWVSKSDNKCPICSGERTITLTKDNQENMYFIYQCSVCKSTQAEKA
jgi:hypothetical protein